MSVGSTVMQVGTTSSVPVSIISTLPLTNLSFTVEYPANRFTNWLVTASNNAVGTALAQNIDPSQTAFNLAAKDGQTFNGPGVIGSLTFAALPGSSAFVPLSPTKVFGTKTDGSAVGNSGGQGGPRRCDRSPAVAGGVDGDESPDAYGLRQSGLKLPDFVQHKSADDELAARLASSADKFVTGIRGERTTTPGFLSGIAILRRSANH